MVEEGSGLRGSRKVERATVWIDNKGSPPVIADNVGGTRPVLEGHVTVYVGNEIKQFMEFLHALCNGMKL
ncbi:hypothetical protein JCGZ_10334 [Jatropha curcas]|uniref:Uncharacterized protein n=1 Tax=Jatropha curcas TaxID=180498 RepID=A0A067KLI3_JATCU|nr:hypothetical protein JCGZ_10334 [Jatropha curcas]